MGEARASEMSVHLYVTTWRNITENMSSQSPPSEPQISHNTCIIFATNILEHKYIFNLQLWHFQLMHLPYHIPILYLNANIY